MDDGNDDQVDSTLSTEWTLPDLPKTLTPSLSTAEFEDIFGGSGDEEGNFPLSVGGLQGHLDNVLLPNPNELFNTSIPEPLNMETKPEEEESVDDKMDVDKNNKDPQDDSTVDKTDTNTTSTCNSSGDTDNKEHDEVQETTPTSTSIAETTNEGEEPCDEAKPTCTSTNDSSNTAGTTTGTTTGTVGRRSARIKAREEQNNMMVAENVTIKSEGPAGDEVFDEENLVDSLLEKNNEIFDQKGDDDDPSSSVVVDDNPPTHDNEVEEDSSVEYSGDEDSDDPDKLWCICQQPHNDRFMICCDSCGEWYHGDCIGISVAEGKRMEKTGQEYVCTKCIEREHTSKAEKEKNRSMRLARREQMREKQLAEHQGKNQSESTDASQDGSTDLFLPDNLSDKEKANLKQQQKKKLRIRDLVRKPCLGPGCEKEAVRPCLYCSDQCIEKHCEFSLKKLSVRGLLPKGGQGVTLYEPSTKKMLTGISAPAEKELLQFIKEHQSYKVFVPSQKVVSAAKKPLKKLSSSSFRRESEKDDQVPDSSTNKLSLDSSAIRMHAKKALKQVLMARGKNATDIEKSEDEITELANDIELKLYNLYNQDVTQKYKSKCRSLLFNLKDTKNQVLFKKIVTGELSTRQLVRMTPDQLASDELAEWREKTIKKELEMIKEVAIEEAQMSSSGIIRKMTYKGEVEIERQSEIEVVQPVEEVVTSTTPEIPAPAPPTSPPSSPTKTTPATTVKVKTEPKSSGIEAQDLNPLTDLLTNTTSQHGTHVFDHNCDICLGKTSSSGAIPTTKTTFTLDNNNSDAPSPDSRTMDSELSVTEVTSPDPIDTYSDPLPSTILTPMVPLWSGTVSMHGLETTTVMAYPVSGPIDKHHIANTFPESLLIVGRIAHAQVWDYIDKLRGSMTKDIVVLRFERVESDKNTYLDLMDYLISKHRYGVIQCTDIEGIKDMYLVPLQYDDPLPPYLYPFTGPGLPINRKDTFLCIITKLKQHQPTSVPPPRDATPRKRKHSGRTAGVQGEGRGRHLTPDVTPTETTVKKPRIQQVVIGLGDTTPPPRADDGSQDTVTVSPAPTGQVATPSTEDIKHRPFFYRETEFKEPVKKEPSSDTGVGAGNTSSGNVKSILSTLSEEKIKELASAAMSSMTPTITMPPAVVKDVKKEISIPAESTSLMKGGNVSQYSISTAELVREDEHVSSSVPRTLSLDERLKATFGGGGVAPEAQPHSSHPGSYDYNPSYPPGVPHDPNYGYQQQQQHHIPPRGGPPHDPRSDPRGGPPQRSDYNMYHQSPLTSSSFRQHQPDRYHDYNRSSNYNSPHRYDSGDDYYRNRGRPGDKGDYNDRRGRDDYHSRGGDRGGHWRNNPQHHQSDSYRDRDDRGAGDHRTIRRGSGTSGWSDGKNRPRNTDDYGRQ